MKTRKIKTFILTILFVFLVFQQAILIYCPKWGFLSYVDEALMCIFLVLIILRMIRHPVRLLKTELVLVSAMLVFLAFGIVSTIANPVQGLFLSATDAMICCRFVVYYLAARTLLDADDTRMFIHAVSICCRVAAVVLTLLALHEIFFPKWFHSFDVRFGFDTLQLIFPHPTYLAFAAFTLAVPLMLRMGIRELKCRRDFFYIVLLLFVTFMTGRSKAVGAMACSLLIWVFYVMLKNRSKLFIGLSGGILAFAVGWNSLFDYYITNEGSGAYAIRVMMHQDAATLARNFFPLGSGFGTFGSAVAADNYSPLYYAFDYDKIWGMQPTRSDYLCDTFWPIVIGQNGWIGAACFGIAVACFLLIAFRAVGRNRYIAWAMLSVIIYELISSIAETSFFNPASCVMFFAFALGVNLMLGGETDSI
ncbi:MAG: hypothetical protein IIZ51_11155 [Lachnospiraceae bacterium]|nr:hypothetical protein [Lachnospiraceae bacterium]